MHIIDLFAKERKEKAILQLSGSDLYSSSQRVGETSLATSLVAWGS